MSAVAGVDAPSTFSGVTSSRSFWAERPGPWWRQPTKLLYVGGAAWAAVASHTACDLDDNVCPDRGRGEVRVERVQPPNAVGPTVQASTDSRSTVSGAPVGL